MNLLLGSVVSVVLLTMLTGLVLKASARQIDEADKPKVVRRVARNWIAVGAKQYERGFYQQAEKSLLFAQEYEEYLSSDEREKLDRLLERTREVVAQRKVVFEQIHSAYELIKQGRLREARLFLESSRDSEFLNEEEIGQITEGLRRINERLNEQRMQIDELYRRSMEFYNAGDFEKARAGIAQIDGILAQLCDPAAPAEAEAVEQPAEAAVEVTEKELVDVATEAIQETEPGVPAEPNEQTKPVVETEPAETIEPVAKAEPVTVGQPAEPAVVESTESKAAAEDSSRKKADRRRNLVRRYTEVVVNDAIMKAQNSLSQGELAEALKMVETADRVVKTNQVDLGEELFSEYEIMLKRLTKEIVEQQSEGSR